MKKAVILMANGTEECEALIAEDLLRRAGIRVATASIGFTRAIRSSNNVKIVTDIKAKKIDYNKIDLLILPGGMPGTKNLYRSKLVKGVVAQFNATNKFIGAICAAPSILGKWGYLKGRNATCYPGFEKYLKGANIIKEHVVIDKNIITGSGLGNAIPFSLTLIEKLVGKHKAKKVGYSIGYRVAR